MQRWHWNSCFIGYTSEVQLFFLQPISIVIPGLYFYMTSLSASGWYFLTGQHRFDSDTERHVLCVLNAFPLSYLFMIGMLTLCLQKQPLSGFHKLNVAVPFLIAGIVVSLAVDNPSVLL